MQNTAQRDIIEKIVNAESDGSKFGLGRTRALLEAFGFPEKKLSVVHIAGSNGKGSIAEYVTDILLEEGKTVGTFTSPAVFDYAEKFRINGEFPDEDKLRYHLLRVYERACGMADKPSSFEIEVVAALNLFVDCGAEYAVLECGLGGLEDATNAISCKKMAIISSVSLEHTAVLGNTVTQICRHKAGIIKDCPAVVNSLQCEEARRYFTSLGATFADGVTDITPAEDGQYFTFRGERYFIRMAGSAQCHNAATAALACSMLGAGKGAIVRGLKRARLEGRVQTVVRGDRTYVLDGSHNPASFVPLTEKLASIGGEKTLVFSCLSDKDVQAAADILSPYFHRVIVVPAPSYRRMQTEKIAAAFRDKGPEVCVAESVSCALSLSKDKVTVLCGSFTVLKEGRQWTEKGQ